MSALSPSFRIIFFGTPEFAVPSLSALLQSRHHVAALVTQPDRPKGRGQHIAAPPAKLAAIDHGITVLQPHTLKDDTLVIELTGLAADLGIVVAYGKILPDRILASTRCGFLNVHASLLPRHRGAAPVNRAVMAGDATTGVTIMRVVRELDAGPMFAAASRPIGSDETSEQIEHDLARMGAALLIDVIEELAQGTAVASEQDHRLATYAPRLTKAEGLIDWNSKAIEIHNKVRGLHPWPHAHSHVRGVRCAILRTALPPGTATVVDRPGTVVAASGERLEIATGDGRVIRIVELQPDGRRRMSAREFLSGHGLTAGESLASPP